MKFKKTHKGRPNIVYNFDEKNYISINKSLKETALVLSWTFIILEWVYQEELKKIKTLKDTINFFIKNWNYSWYSVFNSEEFLKNYKIK